MSLENNLFKLDSNFSPFYTGISKKVIICHFMSHLVTYYKYWRLTSPEKEVLDQEIVRLTQSFQTFLRSDQHVRFVKREIRAVLIRSLDSSNMKATKQVTKNLFFNESFKIAYKEHWILSCLCSLKDARETGKYPVFILKPNSEEYRSLEEKVKKNKSVENPTTLEERFTNMQAFEQAVQFYLNKLNQLRVGGTKKEREDYKIDLYLLDLYEQDSEFKNILNNLNQRLETIKTQADILSFVDSIGKTIGDIFEKRQQVLNQGKDNVETKAIGEEDYLPAMAFILAALKNPIIQELSVHIQHFENNHPNILSLGNLYQKSCSFLGGLGVIMNSKNQG